MSLKYSLLPPHIPQELHIPHHAAPPHPAGRRLATDPIATCRNLNGRIKEAARIFGCNHKIIEIFMV